jgi:hypothetical protein
VNLRLAPRTTALLTLALGAVAIGLATVAGRSDLLAAILEPPLPARVLLGAAATVFGVWLLLRSVARVGDGRGARSLIRAVRLAFLAVAAFAAAAGWFLGSPVPIAIALVIAGIDVVETTFLLLVTGREDAASRP